MASDFSHEFLQDLINKAKNPRLSSDKLCWQIIKNISIHRSPEGQVFISLSLGKDGRITFPIRDPVTADIIFDRYIQECSWAPNPRSVSKAIRAREAEGHVGYKQTYPVFTRLAGYGERFVTAIPNPARIVKPNPAATTSCSATTK